MVKPPFEKVFPTRKLINKILFQLDSDITSRTLTPIFRTLYNESEIPSKYGKNDKVLFTMNRLLVESRKRTKTDNMYLQDMEKYLLMKSAQLGNPDAISLLCYDMIAKPKDHRDEANVEQASKLLTELIKKGHGLSFKIIGDINSLMGKYDESKRWYKKYLEIPSLPLRSEVLEKLATIELREGTQNRRLVERRFLEAIKTGKLEDIVSSYFYLALIYIKYDPLKARVLLEECCSQGFKEAFKELGYLEMNYFKNYDKAQLWFKLGMEVFEIECFFGYFDSSIKLMDWGSAVNCYNSLDNMANISKSNYEYVKLFKRNRENDINTALMKADIKHEDNIITNVDSNSNKKARWSL